jgi:hypothetical protein
MATKNPIQEEPTQNLSAPQAEPGAASIAIPRRALLTGAALLVAGGASACCWGRDKPLRTKFMADFTAAFIGDPTKIKDPAPPPATDTWPDPNRLWPTLSPPQTQLQIVADYETFVNALLTVGYINAPPPAYPPGSLGEKIVQFLQAKNWPNGTDVPSEYGSERPTVHLVEISVILDRLLQAINSYNPEHGAGGGGSNWPPH